ncbi:MAG: hypothetical protein AVDCRST_MAG70-1730 [uncultured Thermomicrobiales bacterium]|uniref:Uncharacterized protein n=1 Tax=uncultured Thermomicrobiales bacterium TaxID=1645740 RepID=A0A6J4V142_9BACT|nr:MAG: hypothetical protein AVDCRST_MAG70-1730 [uncultured Thermomicrobiales bacterium]
MVGEPTTPIATSAAAVSEAIIDANGYGADFHATPGASA